MKTNEAGLDRLVRVVLGIVLLALYFLGTVSGVLAIVFLIAGAILVLTGAIGFCPLYALLGIRTKKA